MNKQSIVNNDAAEIVIVQHFRSVTQGTILSGIIRLSTTHVWGVVQSVSGIFMKLSKLDGTSDTMSLPDLHMTACQASFKVIIWIL